MGCTFFYEVDHEEHLEEELKKRRAIKHFKEDQMDMENDEALNIIMKNSTRLKNEFMAHEDIDTFGSIVLKELKKLNCKLDQIELDLRNITKVLYED